MSEGWVWRVPLPEFLQRLADSGLLDGVQVDRPVRPGERKCVECDNKARERGEHCGKCLDLRRYRMHNARQRDRKLGGPPPKTFCACGVQILYTRKRCGPCYAIYKRAYVKQWKENRKLTVGRQETAA